MNIVIALANGYCLALAPYVLSYLYGGMYELNQHQLASTGGPLWLLQFWLFKYFPNFKCCSPSIVINLCESYSGKWVIASYVPKYSLTTNHEDNLLFPFSLCQFSPYWYTHPLNFPRVNYVHAQCRI